LIDPPELMALLHKTTRGRDNEVWFADAVIQRIKQFMVPLTCLLDPGE